MDIYVANIKYAGNVQLEELYKFKNKDISNGNKLIEHCFAYYLLDMILKSKYGIKEYSLEFINKKPYLKSKNKYFSISHCKEYIAICISDFDCGIDIEPIKQRDYEKISKRMNFNSSSLYEFYIEWTKYEAAFKMSKDIKSIKYYNIEDCVLTAVSSGIEEEFNIYIKNKTDFSKSII